MDFTDAQFERYARHIILAGGRRYRSGEAAEFARAGGGRRRARLTGCSFIWPRLAWARSG